MEINDDPGFCFQLTLVSFIRWFYIIGQCNICDLTLAVPILLSEQDHFVCLKNRAVLFNGTLDYTLYTIFNQVLRCSGLDVHPVFTAYTQSETIKCCPLQW